MRMSSILIFRGAEQRRNEAQHAIAFVHALIEVLTPEELAVATESQFVRRTKREPPQRGARASVDLCTVIEVKTRHI